jgi:Tol biopolymer transport system component
LKHLNRVQDPIEAETGVFVVSSDGSGLRTVMPLRDRRLCYSPSWSPDGTRIAFVEVRGHRPKGASTRAISLVNADGSGYTVLWRIPEGWFSNAPVACWSPVGPDIAYARDQSFFLLSVVPHSRPTVRQVATRDVLWWKWSPDGKSIGYRTGRHEAEVLCTLEMASGRTRDESDVENLAWRPVR